MTLFRRMLREEVRLHADLFGTRRFLALPVFVASIVAGAAWLLGLTGTETETVVAGIHALVFFFGLQVGTIGLVGRDAMRNALGETTLLVFSARTLPLSRQRLLATFLVKDLVYYLGFFLTPVVAGFAVLAVTGDFAAGKLGVLWISVTGTFALGAASSLTLAGIATRSRIALFVTLLVLVGSLVFAPLEVVSLSPYGAYLDLSVGSVALGFAPLVVLLVAGPVVFEPPSSGGVRRIEGDWFGRLQSRWDSQTARALLEVSRSSGSVWKVAFSLGVLFAVTALLLDRIVAATAIEPSGGIAFGTLLGLGTFTTYNWVTQLDDAREYLRYPERMDAVFAGKRRAFFVLSMPTGLLYLALAGVWYPTADLLFGVVVFPLVSVYVYGVTAYLTGLSPGELLFDTVRFGVYGIALAAVAVPLLVSALAYGEFPVQSGGVAVALSAVAALVGVVLARRTGSRWHGRLRRES
jgi:hypothetical protein